MSSLSKVFIGLGALGRALQGDPNSMVFVLTDKHKDDICYALFFREKGREAIGDEHLKDEAVQQAYSRLKDIVRSAVQRVFDEAAREDERERQRELERVKQQLRASNRPHPMGTVEELAKRFNVSKSEIRRRKQDGTLNELEEVTQ